MANQIFYDPATGQVMAVYRGCRTNSQEWARRGFEEITTDRRVTQDHKITVVDGRVTQVTDSPRQTPPSPPDTPPTPRDKFDAFLKTIGLTEAQFKTLVNNGNPVR